MYSEKREVPHLKNDQELVNKIRRGDKEAFSLLVKDLMPSAYKNSLSYTSIKRTRGRCTSKRSRRGLY